MNVNSTDERRCEMNTMNMPGFTAESSVYRRSRFYQHTDDFSNITNNLIPQACDEQCFQDCIDGCVGLPGQQGADCRRRCPAHCCQPCHWETRQVRVCP